MNVQYAEKVSQTILVLCCNEMCLFQLPGEEEGHNELHEVATPNEVEKLNS